MRSLLFASLFAATLACPRDAFADEPGVPPRSVSRAMEVIFGRSFCSLRGGPELVLRGLPELRQPQWTGPDPPKPPLLHAPLLRIAF